MTVIIGLAAIVALLTFVCSWRLPPCKRCGCEGNCCNCWYGD